MLNTPSVTTQRQALPRMSFQLRFEVIQVAVLIDLAGNRFAHQADAVDDAGVVQLVGEDDVVRADERGKQRLVGVPAAYVA